MAPSTYVVNYSEDEIKKAHEVLYHEGLRMRIKVAGKEYVEKSLEAAKDPFSKPMQEVSAVFPEIHPPTHLSTISLILASSSQNPAGAASGPARA